jgi:glutathione synthase/RimK-type ligase-like ATP-grasp enzyme
MLRVPPSPLATTIRDLAIRAANVMETKNDAQHELSVDFIVDRQRHPWIIEVNGSPQKKIYRDLHGFRDWDRLYRTPLQLTWSHYLRGTPDR